MRHASAVYRIAETGRADSPVVARAAHTLSLCAVARFLRASATPGAGLTQATVCAGCAWPRAA